MNEIKQNKNKPVFFGVVLIALGLALVANQFDIIPFRFRDVLFSWQAFLILLGVIFVSTRDNKATGYILIGIGGFFILPEFLIVPDIYRNLFWPVFLIVVGLVILFSRGYFFQRRHNITGTDINFLSEINIFGGHDRIITAQEFRGGSIVSIFGGGKYDFRNAVLSNERNILEMISIFGGGKLIVPEDWDVKVEVLALFGGFSDKRRVLNVNHDKVLIIKGVALFGGGEIVSF
jgi:predicted membrane protein